MPERRYWDTAAFLALLKDEPERAEQCRTVIAAAEAGDVEIWTSALTMCEVLWPKGRPDTKAALRRNRERVREMFEYGYVKLIQMERLVAETAQEVVWDYGVKPKDAVHVASAIRANIQVIHTFDKGLLRKNGKIGDPPIRIEIPYIPPDAQLDLLPPPPPDETQGEPDQAP